MLPYKKTITASLFILVLASACSERQAELERVKSQRDSLQSLLQQRDSSLNSFLVAYSVIQQNLDSITERGNIISKNIRNQVELKSNSKDKIIQDIRSINQLMEQNRNKIEELNKKLKNSSFSSIRLEAMIKSLNEQLQTKDDELIALNDQLSMINSDVIRLETTLETVNLVTDEQSKVISEQTSALHTAYYVIGSSKELEEKKVISRTGGVLGLGKTSQLSSRVNNDNFIKIDYQQTTVIPVNSKSVQIITTHPSDSFTLERDERQGLMTALRITDPEKFWAASKYLVMVAK